MTLEFHALERLSETVPIELLVATHNAHKTAEFASMLDGEFLIRDLRTLPELPDVEETGATFEENAILKALGASAATPSLVLADDSGLEVDALGGAPGIYSARYAGENSTDAANVAKLLTELSAAGVNRGAAARFRCALALAQHGRIMALFHGVVDGRIAGEPRGNHGFGYDPIFVPAGFSQTFAQLGKKAKNRISHRRQAIIQLRSYLSGTRR